MPEFHYRASDQRVDVMKDLASLGIPPEVEEGATCKS